MKRLIILLMLSAVVLTGCSGSKPREEPLPEGGYDNSGDRLVVYSNGKMVPLAFSKDGENQIEAGTYWYYELADQCEARKGDSFFTYDIKKAEFSSERSYDKMKRRKCYGVNGDWPLFLYPVHTYYAKENQDLLEETIKTAVAQCLKSNGMEGSTAVVSDIWVCDFDGDGNTETFFYAANEEEQNSYSFLGYLKGENCQVIANTFSRDRVAELTPLIMDLSGTGSWSLVLKRDGDYDSFSVYTCEGGNFAMKYQIIY